MGIDTKGSSDVFELHDPHNLSGFTAPVDKFGQHSDAHVRLGGRGVPFLAQRLSGFTASEDDIQHMLPDIYGVLLQLLVPTGDVRARHNR